MMVMTRLEKRTERDFVAAFSLLSCHFTYRKNFVIQWATAIGNNMKLIQCPVNFDSVHLFGKQIYHRCTKKQKARSRDMGHQILRRVIKQDNDFSFVAVYLF